MRGSECKLAHGGFQLNIKQKVFALRVAEYWNVLSRVVVGSLSLEIVKDPTVQGLEEPDLIRPVLSMGLD